MTEEQIHSCTLMLLAPKRRARKPPCKAVLRLEFLLLSEEHSEADDGAVNEQTADDAHDHCLNADLLSVCQDYGKSCKPRVSTRCPRFSCASRDGDIQNVPIPMTTKNPVKNLPNSTMLLLPESMKSSFACALLHIQLGTGAST